MSGKEFQQSGKYCLRPLVQFRKQRREEEISSKNACSSKWEWGPGKDGISCMPSGSQCALRGAQSPRYSYKPT